MKKKRDRRPICHCAAYSFPHKQDRRRCKEATGTNGDDYSIDHKLDNPQRGQAAELNRLIRRVS